MFDYLAPSLTLGLAVLGFFFARERESTALSRLGYVILLFTIISGGISLIDIYRKNIRDEAQKAANEAVQRDAHRVNNLITAGVLGINKRFTHLDLWGGHITQNEESVLELTKSRGRPPKPGEFVMEADSRPFNGGLVSRRDMKQKTLIEGTLFNHDLKFEIAPKNENSFTVRQNIQETIQTYECERQCPPPGNPRPSKKKLAERPIFEVEELGSESSYGLDLAEGGSVGSVMSATSKHENPFLTIKASFSDKYEHERFRRVVAGTSYKLKLYGEGIMQNKECHIAVIIPADSEVKHEALKLTTEIRLTAFQSADIDLCEDGP